MKLSNADKRGLCVLLLVLLLVSIIKYANQNKPSTSERIEEKEIILLNEFEKNLSKKSTTSEVKEFKEENLFPFDPNNADSQTLVQLGFSQFHIRNILKYRAKGGKWIKAEDFKKLYGLKESDYKKIYPYITIKPHKKILKNHLERVNNYNKSSIRTLKYELGTKIDLNQSDTTELKKIPGIGSYYAKKIIHYRNKLGGFISPLQLYEIEGLPSEIHIWFYVDKQSVIKKLQINRSNFKELLNHPYLSYEQVQTIMNYKRKYGKITSLEILENSDQFSKDTIEKLIPYLSFE